VFRGDGERLSGARIVLGSFCDPIPFSMNFFHDKQDVSGGLSPSKSPSLII
jgi:hypothetical protein